MIAELRVGENTSFDQMSRVGVEENRVSGATHIVGNVNKSKKTKKELHSIYSRARGSQLRRSTNHRDVSLLCPVYDDLSLWLCLRNFNRNNREKTLIIASSWTDVVISAMNMSSLCGGAMSLLTRFPHAE